MVKGLNKLSDAVKHATHEKEAQAATTTKVCPYCKSEIHIAATAVPTAPRCWRTKRQSNDSEN